MASLLRFDLAISARDGAISTSMMRFHNTIVCAPDDLRETLRKMTRMQLIRTLAAWRPDLTDYRSVVSAYAAHHRHRPTPDRSPNQGLHCKAGCGRPLETRGHPMPKALYRARGLFFDQSPKAGNQPGRKRCLTIRRASKAANIRRWHSASGAAR